MNEEEMIAGEQGGMGAPPPEEMPAEEQEQMPEEQEQPDQQEPAEPGGDAKDILPPEMNEVLVKSAQALFYNAVQMLSQKKPLASVLEDIKSGDFTAGVEYLMDMACKIQKRDKLPMSVPSIIAATYYVAQLVGSIAESRKVSFPKNAVNRAVVEYTDRIMGEMKGAGAKKKQGEEAAGMRSRQQQEAQAAQQNQGPPPGGMGAAQGAMPPPQGGLM